MTSPFVHLHVHSHHSLGGGLASVDALMRRASELEMPALALTDHANLSGLVAMIEAGRRYGVKPIIGCDLPVAPFTAAPDLPGRGGRGQEPLPEITLLAATDGGLRNLVALTNQAASRSAAGASPHVKGGDLRERREGLIAVVGGPRSELHALVNRGNAQVIEAHLNWLVGIFGRGQIHFEIVDRGLGLATEVNRRLTQIAEFLGMAAFASNDVWYLEPSHALAHDFLRGRPCDPARWMPAQRRQPPTEHFSTPSEMRDRFTHRPQLLEHSLRLAERCNAAIDLARHRFPRQDFTRGVDANSFLWDLVFRHAPERLGPLTDEHKERLNTELDQVANEGLANYLLILWNLAQELDRAEIPRGVGEGRVTTSLVAHVLGLTEVNPLLHRLPFRGLRERGETWPRLSLDVPSRAVAAAQQQLAEICGATKVALVGEAPKTHRGKLRRDLCLWAGVAPSQVARVLASWPKRTVSIEEAQRAWEGRAAEETGTPKSLPRPVVAYLAQAIHPRLAAIVPLAGQIVVSGEDLTQFVPLAPVPDSPLPLCQIEPAALDRLGLLRVEVRTPPVIDILDRATTWVRHEESAEFHPSRIPFDDHDTWVLMGRGLTTGIPGVQRISTKSRLRAAQPRSLAELIEVLEASRPLGEPSEERPLPPIAEAIQALRCAHLKTHHPVSFMAAMLTQHFGDRRLLRVLLREATGMGVRLLVPDINTSQFEFSQEGSGIRAGLLCVRGMTPEAHAAIDRARRSGAFQDLPDLWERVDHRAVPASLVGNLIKGGVLDSLDSDRSRMLAQIAHIARGGWRPAASGGQALDLFEAPLSGPDGASEALDAATLARYEEQVLGTVLTQDPLTPHAELIRRTRAVAPQALQTADDGAEITAVGFIDHGERAKLFGEREEHILDLEGQVVLVPREVFAGLSEILLRGDPVLVAGTVGRRGHERFLKAQCVVPLSKVERVAAAVASVGLDLTGENRRTVKLLLALCQQYPGQTKIEILGQPPRISRRLCHRLEQLRVYYAPPLSLRLRKILPDESITLRQRALSEIPELA